MAGSTEFRSQNSQIQLFSCVNVKWCGIIERKCGAQPVLRNAHAQMEENQQAIPGGYGAW
jgi:hypothetical protein